MKDFIYSTVARAKLSRKTIVLPEGDDMRTLKAAEWLLKDNVANLIILGDAEAISNTGYVLDGAEIIDPRYYPECEELANELYEIRKAKGMTIEKANELIKDVMYLGVMMVKTGKADGMVAGACHYTADVLRPSLQILKTAPGSKLVSSFFIMCVPGCNLGSRGTFLFSDCGLVVNPNAEELANIAISSADSFREIISAEPVVAMISHSTRGSANNDDAKKVAEATALAKEIDPELALDGEMQVDAAIIPEIGAMKAPRSHVAGRANVLIFPDLDAGSVAYKLVQRLAKAEAYGPILQGIAAPVNDLSRGCIARDIYGVVAITCVQAQIMEKKRKAAQNS
ncbi:MAG: phosphate acetyltransferase [Eggerthellaceae bacterium]|nr:phosphate acetyltransferase [Eggerthellaceae bacterium]